MVRFQQSFSRHGIARASAALPIWLNENVLVHHSYIPVCGSSKYLLQNPYRLHDLLECDVRYIAEIGLNRRQRVAYLDALLVYYGYHLDAIHAVQSVRILQEVF